MSRSALLESGLEIYAVGLCCLSACTSLTDDEATAAVNERSPTGIRTAWEISSDTHFAGGEIENGSACPDRAGYRHVLFQC